MLSAPGNPHPVRLMAQAEAPPSVLFAETEMDLSLYRHRTIALVRRYARASVEVGRLPSLLGQQFFRTHVTSYSLSSFEEIVIFVIDMEHTLEQLDPLDKKLAAMFLIEQYTAAEITRFLNRSERTIGRLLHNMIDELSRLLLVRGLLERMPEPTRGVSRSSTTRENDLELEENWQFLESVNGCQADKSYKDNLSHSNNKRNKSCTFVETTPSNLLF